LKRKLDVADQNFLRSVLKFADRAKKMPKSKLTSCFHSFGAAGVCHTCLTATSIVKKAKRGKIHVHPESVKRRKVAGPNTKEQHNQMSGWESEKSAYVCRKMSGKMVSGKESGKKYGNKDKSV
jgi:hypothetical protein